MVNIIVVFSSQKDAVNIRNLLVRRGHHVIAACTSAAMVNQVIDQMEGSDGIIISGFRYQDMHYDGLLADLPKTYQMIVMASPAYLDQIPEYEVLKIPMPVKTYDLMMTLENVETSILRQRKKRREKPKERTAEEKACIDTAKSLLMQAKKMTEKEAHRYMQECSMHNGTNLVETARMLMDIYAAG